MPALLGSSAAVATDQVMAGTGLARSAADSALGADLTRGSMAVAHDTAGTTDAVARTLGPKSTSSDAALTSDSVGRGLRLPRATADSCVATDAPVRSQALPRVAGEFAVTTDMAWTSRIVRDSTAQQVATAPILTMTWQHTVGSGPLAVNRLLLVVVDLLTPTGQKVTGVTYGGQALQRAGFAGSAPVRTEIWYLVAPPSGTATVAVTFTKPVPAIGGSISLFGVREGVPIRTTAGAAGFGWEISEDVAPVAAQPEDLVIDSATMSQAEALIPGHNQTEWMFASFAEFAGASSYAPPLPLEWATWPPTNWAYLAVVVEPLYRPAVVANDQALTADTIQAGFVPTPGEALDKALTTDTAVGGVSGPVQVPGPRSSALGAGFLGDSVLGGLASDRMILVDQALAIDTAIAKAPNAYAADTAYAFDYTGEFAPISAEVTTSGVLGHMVFGWWVLGMRDTYVRGRQPTDVAVTVDSGAITAVLYPRGLHDTALAWAAATRTEALPRPRSDHALTTDAASPFRFSTGVAADTATSTDAPVRQARLARRANDQALAVDEAHRLAPQPGHSYDGAYTDDLATQHRGHVTPTADTSLSSDAASARPGVGATDNAITSERATHTNLSRATAVDASTSVDHGRVVGGPAAAASDTSTATDHATATRYRAALDAATTTDKATGIVGPSATAADASTTTDTTSAFRVLRAAGKDTSVTVDHVLAGHPLARTTADTSTTTDSPTRGSSRSVADSALEADTATAGRPSVRVTHDVCTLTDAGAWTRFAPRSTTDTVLSTDGATAMLEVSAADVALTFETAHVASRLGAIAVDSAPAFDRGRIYVLVRPRMIGFGKTQPQWRFGKAVTSTNRPAAFDYAGRL